jgi:hypothetical protein
MVLEIVKPHPLMPNKLSSLILKVSDDGVQYSELMHFWTLSIVWDSKNHRIQHIRNLDLFLSSREGGEIYSVGPLRKS